MITWGVLCALAFNRQVLSSQFSWLVKYLYFVEVSVLKKSMLTYVHMHVRRIEVILGELILWFQHFSLRTGRNFSAKFVVL